MTRKNVEYSEDNKLLQQLDQLNLKNEQLRFLRSSKTIGRGRKRSKRRRMMKEAKRTEENEYASDSSLTMEEPVAMRPQRKEAVAISKDENNKVDYVLVNWNQLQWNTRKRKRNVETEEDFLVERPLGQVSSDSEAAVEQGMEAWKNCVRDVSEQPKPESHTRLEEEQQRATSLETYCNPRLVCSEKSEDSTSCQLEMENSFVKLGSGATKPKVQRKKEEWESRMKLPICEREQEIVELVNERDIVFIAAETGSGKTTQVPQFLFEAGYCCLNKDGYIGKIVITQPRRVGAFACSSRVAKELHVTLGAEVGYHVRHFRKVSRETKIEFVTDGILLRLIQADILLRDYSVVILDEAHERSIDTDLILGLVTRSVGLRRSMFDNNEKMYSFPMKITRGYPVHIHFAKKTVVNYVEAAFKTVCKIHRQLPRGDVLVFLTGRREVLYLCQKLAIELQGTLRRKKSLHQLGNERVSSQDVRILPLYSMLPWKKQQRIFSVPKKECRTIVVATNVAETSVTIPNVVYVVDSGRVKKKEYTSMQGKEAFSTIRFRVKWTSQSSAEQRAGRAGRICEGHCYRLYSAAVFLNEMEEQEEPEIQTTPAEALLLKLKSLKIDVHNFPFPSPPSEESLKNAERVLHQLGALHISSTESILTSLGKKLAKLPLSSRLGKLVIENCISVTLIGCAIRMAAILTVPDLFVFKEEENELEEKKTWISMKDTSKKYGLRDKSVREVSLIVNQLSRLLIKLGWISESWHCSFPSSLHPPNRKERNLLLKPLSWV
ncbi:Probable ATP-dependent RNA helicase kurz [Galdieria sulphuraria]|nr:Probable ATP-dependent RNA helicase kurz [Galdieria sulphuraria]